MFRAGVACSVIAFGATSSSDIDVFSAEWYHADAEFDLKQSKDGIEWDFQHNHLENKGLVTHFSAVDLKEGSTVTLRAEWTSDQDTKWSEKCSSKYWKESKYDHACVVDDKIASDCKETIECPVNTGDFRIVLADSKGGKVTKSGFDTLQNSNVSGKWEGFHIRVMPHVTTKFKRRSLIFPNTVWMKNPNEKRHPGMFDHSSTEQQVVEMRDQADTGGFGVEPGKSTTFTIQVSRSSKSHFNLEVSMGNHTYNTTWDFAEGHAPESLDTFAIAQPNLRAYKFLKLTSASAKELIV